LYAGLAVGGALASLPSADASEPSQCVEKPNVVVLGTGWAAISFLKALKPLQSAIADRTSNVLKFAKQNKV